MIFSVEFGFENIMVVRTNQTHEERRLLPPWPMAIIIISPKCSNLSF
jgi:hypothetical protein